MVANKGEWRKKSGRAWIESIKGKNSKENNDWGPEHDVEPLVEGC